MSNKLILAILALSFSFAEAAHTTVDFGKAKAVELAPVNTAIRAYGANWTAKENWVSRLSRDEVKRMLGLREMPDVNIQFSARETSSNKRTNTVLDWRSVNGVNWVTPVKNQGNCGSCVAFATAGTLETQMNISAKLPDMMPKVSTQALFACGGGSCDWGWEPSDAESFLASNGVPDEACLPYTSGATGADVECSAACSDIASRSVKIVPSKHKVSGLSINSVKQALVHGPLETTLVVYADFLTYASGVYKHVTGEALGGHAVSIVGYDDNQQAWIVRNSWGNDWGNKGFMLVSYKDTSGVAGEVWGYDLPSEEGYVSFTTPSDQQVLSGLANLKVASTVDANSTLNYTIKDSSGKTVVQNSVHGVAQSLPLDTTQLKDGHYEVFATAVTPSNAKVNSLHVEFYVLNNHASGTLAFTPQDFDMSKPLVDRVVFNVSAPSSPVPYSMLTLHIQQNGQDVLTKSIDTVLPDMTFGWRTQTVPNGKYDIFMTAKVVADGNYAFSSESTHATVSVKN